MGKGDESLTDLYYTLDNFMKQRTTAGLGRKVSANIVTLDAEEKMWAEGILGEDHPKQLVDTVLYLLGIHLALRGGEEHRRLRRPGFNPQITISKDTDGETCLIFKEDIKTKTNQGGLGCREIQPRTTYVYKSENPKRCPVRLYDKYCSLLPKIAKRSELYLHPLAKPMPWMWYADRAMGINTIRATVKRLAVSAGLEGKFTNHSLRASSASCLFEAGIPEKVIKEITGHRSDAVREYERTPNSLKRAISATISKCPDKVSPEKQLKISSTVSEKKVENCQSENQVDENVHAKLAQSIQSATVDSIVKNVDTKNLKKVTVHVDLKF